MLPDPFKVRAQTHQPKKLLIMSQPRLDRMILNAKSSLDEKEEEEIRMQERKERQEATKALSKLIMQKKEPGSVLRKKQYERDVKEAHYDMEREARIEARRNIVLDQAYKRLYEETDRVKYFKSAKNLSETLDDRDTQIEGKEKMKDLYDKNFVLGMIRDVDNYAREEAKKEEKVLNDRRKNAENWMKQVKEVQKKMRKEELEHLRNGFIVRQAAEKYAEEVRKSELENQRKIEEYKKMLDKQKDEKLTLLDMHEKLDEADEKRAEIFNKTKMEIKIKHQQVKKELDKQKEMKRHYVASNLKDESMALKQKEEAILQKAILEADAKQQQENAIKQAKHDEALKSIQEHYEKEMAEKARKAMDEKRQGFQERMKIERLVEDKLQTDDSKAEQKRKSEEETQHTQLHQMAKKQTDKRQEKIDDMVYHLNHIRSLYNEEEIFQKYAQIEIDDCEARGLNTRPMRVAARPGIECGKGPLYEHRGNIRPRYYSAVSGGDELNHIERTRNLPDTKSRLGFMLH